MKRLAWNSGLILSNQGLKLDLDQLRQQLGKPIRVAWANRSYFHPTDLHKSEPYVLFVLCSASKRVHGAEMSEGGYIQGAGDDSEGWAHGLTPPVFWANRAILKQTPEEDLPDVISELVKEYQQQSAGQTATLVSPTRNLFISQTDALVNESGQYDLIINCNGSPTATDGNEKRLNLGCASAKLGSRDLRQVLDKVREFVSAQLEVDPSRSLLVTCDTGKDLSAGALLAIICLFYKDDGNVLCPQKSLDKFRRSMKRGIKKTRLTLIVQEPSMSRRARTQSASSSSDSVSRGSFRPNTM